MQARRTLFFRPSDGAARKLRHFLAAFAKATTFDVSGQFSYVGSSSTGTFSGTLAVSGVIAAVNMKFPGWPAFQQVYESTPSGSDWLLTADNVPDGTQELDMKFTTSPTPGSLVGFTGGTIVSGQVVDVPCGGCALFNNLSGSISPAPLTAPGPAAVPEPCSRALLAMGLSGIWLSRRRAANAGGWLNGFRRSAMSRRISVPRA